MVSHKPIQVIRRSDTLTPDHRTLVTVGGGWAGWQYWTSMQVFDYEQLLFMMHDA